MSDEPSAGLRGPRVGDRVEVRLIGPITAVLGDGRVIIQTSAGEVTAYAESVAVVERGTGS